MTSSLDHQGMIEINLEGPPANDEAGQVNIIGGVYFGRDAKALTFKDGGEDGPQISLETHPQRISAWAPPNPADDGKPRLRYFSVGPSTYQIRCPLCKQHADTETVQMRGALGSLSCVLSLFSCCFPIFALSFVYLCLQSRLKSKRMFCNKCGGYLGFFRRPT